MMRLAGLLLSMPGWLLSMIGLAAAGPMEAPPPAGPAPATIRTGTHPGFGRVVISQDNGPVPRFSREGDRLIVTVAGQDMTGSALPPRNVRALRPGPGRAEMTIAPGAVVRTSRNGQRLVIDVLDPPSGTGTDAAEAPASPARRLTLPLPPMPPPVPAIAPAAAPPPSAEAPATAASVQPVMTEPLPAPAGAPTPASAMPPTTSPPSIPVSAGPAALAARVLAAAQGDGILLPFEAGVGAAAFRRGNTGLIVFDQRRPLDLAGLREHPVFGAAQVQLLAGGTLLRMPVPAEANLLLTRHPQGWQLALTGAGAAAQITPIRATHIETRLLFAAQAPGAVLAMTDPETGATLLVGTQLRAGQAMPVTRHWAIFIVGRSWQGLVVEPLSDQLSLRPGTDGFVLSGGAAGLPIGDDTQAGERMAQAEQSTRRFGFSSASRDYLRGLQRTQLLDAADAPPLARGPQRRALGLTLISLGLAPEAQTVLDIAATDDPREAELPETIGLTAIAALLAGRIAESTGLDDPRLGEGDEIRLWRAVRLAMRQEGADAAAVDFATTLPLLLTYPEALQERLLPLALETLLLSGRTDAARDVLKRMPEMPQLAFARALLAQADAQTEPTATAPTLVAQALSAQALSAEALAALDALADGRDRLLRARAGARAAEWRLARGDLTPATAAAALDKLIFAWRGDARDLALRLRVAELRVQAGNWRPALALLRDSEAAFPEAQAMLQARQRLSVAQLLQASAMESMAALDLVALVDENAALMPDGETGLEIAARLSDRLMTLDLPNRAALLLQKLVASTPAGPVRAGFGAKLAGLRLQENDAAGARMALDSSGAEGLPDSLIEERSVLAARTQAGLGDPVAAVAALGNLQSEAALRARATILEESHNWPQATEALRALVVRIVPGEGKLDDTQQRSLLRLATVAAQAGDAALLAQLREKEMPRLTAGPVADLFRLLTADSIQGVADLPRAGRELALARALSSEPARR